MRILLALASGLLLGCKSVNPTTGKKEFDPVKTEQVKAALEPVVTSAVRRMIQNSPEHREEIIRYLQGIGNIFCHMAETRTVDPVYLVNQADALTATYQAKLPDWALDVKNAVVALYKIQYANRHSAELSAEQWPVHVADLCCQSIRQALKDVGA